MRLIEEKVIMDVMKKPTVSVLLSTYNGEKYIRELVDSVLCQKDVEIKLQIRDDGSSDDTIKILRQYCDPRISICIGKNLGATKSFLTLLQECEYSDYYAYCDQDDVWYPDKLITAVEELKKYEEPALFISTYDVVDENLNKLFTYNMKFENQLKLQDTIIYRAPSACNMVFNHRLRNIINKSTPQFARMHDFWTLLVAESHGFKIVTKNIPLIKYRQHSGELVGITPNIVKRIKRLMFSWNRGNNERWRQAKELYDFYKDEMLVESKNVLMSVIKYRESFLNRIRLINDPSFKTPSKYVNVLFKLSILTGKF